LFYQSEMWKIKQKTKSKKNALYKKKLTSWFCFEIKKWIKRNQCKKQLIMVENYNYQRIKEIQTLKQSDKFHFWENSLLWNSTFSRWVARWRGSSSSSSSRSVLRGFPARPLVPARPPRSRRPSSPWTAGGRWQCTSGPHWPRPTRPARSFHFRYPAQKWLHPAAGLSGSAGVPWQSLFSVSDLLTTGFPWIPRSSRIYQAETWRSCEYWPPWQPGPPHPWLRSWYSPRIWYYPRYFCRTIWLPGTPSPCCYATTTTSPRWCQ